MSEYHHLHNILLVVNHKCGRCIQLHLQAKPDIITSFAWVYSVVCFSFNVERMIKIIKLGSRRTGSKQKFLHKNYTIYKNQLFVSVLLIPRFTMHNFIQTQLHSSVIYWQSWPGEIIWL